MEEELNYETVTFNINGVSTFVKPNNLGIIYDEVKTEEQPSNTTSVISENEKKAPVYTLLHLVTAILGIICVILVSVAITLGIRLNTVISEQERENMFLKRQNELIRERDRLNWTIGVILEYKNFSVNSYCPQKVCKPCLDNWVLFQSSCYLFSESNYSFYWRNWQESRDECRNITADLVVIESQEEQEFINNYTKYYNDQNHGYWIGLKKNMKDTWMWLDERNLTVTHWNKEGGNGAYCALNLPAVDPLASWKKSGCDMKNRWICERRALIRPF